MSGYTMDTRIPVDELRMAFFRSGWSATSLASEIGWVRGDSTRLLRAIGCKPSVNGHGRKSVNQTIDMEDALLIATPLGLDPVDLGA